MWRLRYPIRAAHNGPWVEARDPIDLVSLPALATAPARSSMRANPAIVVEGARVKVGAEVEDPRSILVGGGNSALGSLLQEGLMRLECRPAG